MAFPVTQNPAITANHLIRMVRIELGQDRGHGPGVELSDGQIVYAIRSAVSEYSRYWPLRSYQSFNAPVGVFEFKPDPKINGIIELSMVPTNDVFVAGISIPEMTFYSGHIYGTGARVDYSTPLVLTSYIEWRNTTERVLSQKPSWYFADDLNKLYIYSPLKPVSVHLVGTIERDSAYDEEVLWDSQIPDTDADASEPELARISLTLSEIPKNHFKWIKDLSLAKAMLILGRMRSKYGSIPSTEDKDIQLDGNQLIADAKELKQETLDELRQSSNAMFVPSYF